MIRSGENKLYHYTLASRVDEINESGMINSESDAGIKLGRLAVWSTTRDSWEPTCNKGLVENGERRTLSVEEMYVIEGKGVARFQLDWSHGWHDWESYKRKAKYPSDWYARIRSSAKQVGSDVKTHFASFSPVPLYRILDIEQHVRDDMGEWQWTSLITDHNEWKEIREELKREAGY